MACNNNTPTTGYIYIENLIITYNDKNYSINNIYTNKKYLYFNKNNTSDLYVSDTRTIEDDYEYIIKNNNGNALLIDNVNIKMVFDNFDKEGIINNIKKVKLKIVDNEKQVGEITDNVEKLSSNYKQDKSFNEIKEDLNTSIVQYNALLIGLNTSLNTYLKDNKFIENEKIQVNSQLDDISNKSIETLAYADALIDLYCEYNEDKDVDTTKLYQYKVILISLLSQLKNNLAVIINSENEDVNATGIVPVTSCVTGMLNNLSSLKEECNNLIFLGAGGTISDEIYSANNRIDNVVSDLNELQQSVLGSLDTEKKEVQKYFDNMLFYCNKLNTTTNEIIKKQKSVATGTQYSSLCGNLTDMTLNFNKIKGSYENYYSNEKLSDEAKKELKNSFDDFSKKYDNLKNTIYNNFKDLKISQQDYSDYSLAIQEHRSTRNLLNSKILYCINLINNATTETSLKQIEQNLADKLLPINDEIKSIKNDMTVIKNDIENLKIRLTALENKTV